MSRHHRLQLIGNVIELDGRQVGTLVLGITPGQREDVRELFEWGYQEGYEEGYKAEREGE